MNDNTKEFRITMPREFFLLIDYLHKLGEKANGVFNLDSLEFRKARQSQFKEVCNWLDIWPLNDFRKKLFNLIQLYIFILYVYYALIQLEVELLQLKLFSCFFICQRSHY